MNKTVQKSRGACYYLSISTCSSYRHNILDPPAARPSKFEGIPSKLRGIGQNCYYWSCGLLPCIARCPSTTCGKNSVVLQSTLLPLQGNKGCATMASSLHPIIHVAALLLASFLGVSLSTFVTVDTKLGSITGIRTSITKTENASVLLDAFLGN